jgi:hypothetical protein
VWLNPPYGDVGPQFVTKLIKAYESGEVAQAILLINSHCTDAKWFQPFFNYVLCFTNHRPRFWNKKGQGDSPSHGSAFVYLGKRSAKFVLSFRRSGQL